MTYIYNADDRHIDVAECAKLDIVYLKACVLIKSVICTEFYKIK